MNTETQKLAVQAWVKIIGTQEHFNQLMLQARNLLLTLLSALVGAAAYSLQKEIVFSAGCINIHISAILLLAGLPVLLVFYIIERGYHNLLLGAVEQGEAIEKELQPFVPAMGLTGAISRASKKPIFFGSLNSRKRIQSFYVLVALLFMAGALLSFFRKIESVQDIRKEVVSSITATQAGK